MTPRSTGAATARPTTCPRCWVPLGSFDSWTGHDLVLDWAAPLGLEDARLTGGVFNITDASLSVNTANPGSVDGPTEAGWGRTFFLTLNVQL